MTLAPALAMALAMALWVLQTSFKNLEKLNNQTKAILNAWCITGESEEEKNNNIVGHNPDIPNSEFFWLLR